MALKAHDITWFSTLVGRLHACTDERALFDDLTRSIDAHFRSLATAVEEVAYSMATFQLHNLIAHCPLPPDYLGALEDSPMVVRWRSNRAEETLCMSGMASRAALHRTTFYDAICRVSGFDDQLIGTFRTAPETTINFSVQRDSLFSADEWLLMEQVRRHVQACVKRVRRTSPCEPGQPARQIVLKAHERPDGLTPDVARVLSRYFPAARREIAQGCLPEAMRRWVRVSFLTLRKSPPLHPLFCLETEGSGGRLFARLFPGHGGSPALIRLTEAVRHPSVLTLKARGLTTRQCEVLHWLMAGKRNSEIGAILGASERTVSTHVEALLRKTGAETRLAAAHVARGWLEQPRVFGPAAQGIS